MAAKKTAKSYWNGAIVGISQALIFHPIDLFRVRYFLKKQELGPPKTWLNGLSFNATSTAVKQMAVFPTHEIIKNKVKNHLRKGRQITTGQEMKSEIVSGLAAGALLGSIACPINAIKTPQQASQTKRSSFLVAKHIFERYGLMGFYRGGLGIFLRDFSWAGVYFPAYSFFNNQVFSGVVSPRTKISNQHTRKVSSSIFAAWMGMMVAYPFDGSRLYRQHHYGDKNYSFWHGIRKSFELTPGNFKSFTTGMIRVPLATTFCHMLYLYLQHDF